MEQDTVRLLRECDAGVKMGTASIDDVLDYVHSDALREKLSHSKKEHNALGEEIGAMLLRCRDGGKEPNPMAKGMSWMKTNVMLKMKDSDATIADLMTDGCNMGVKSLSRYLNEYKAAEEGARDIASRLIHLEETLSTQLRGYL